MAKAKKNLELGIEGFEQERAKNFHKKWIGIILAIIFLMMLSIVIVYWVEQQDIKNWKKYQNNYDGFSLSYPNDWQQQVIPGVATILSKDGNIKLTILAQPLGKISAEEYILYSNRSLQKGWGGIKLQTQKKTNLHGYEVWQFDWTRPLLVSNDLNYYREYDLVVGQRVYTFMLKTNQIHFFAATKDLSRIISTFKPMLAQAAPTLPPALPVQREVNIVGQYHRLYIPADKTLWGILNPHKFGRVSYFDKLLPLEKQLNFKFQFLITYVAFDTKFDQAELQKIYQDNRILMVALQPWLSDKRNDTSLIGLIQGKYDTFLREWAHQFKSLGDPVFVRFGNEMNGDWSTWSAWYTGKDTDIYKMAWEHVYNLFKTEGANNVIFVFNPYDRSYPNFKWNNYLLYYPGDKTVDWIGLTGYNIGTTDIGNDWRDFDTIYGPLYQEYMHYFPDKPFMITEFACNEKGGDKAAWIRQCFRHMATRYPNIKIAVWFNKVDGKWTLDSSPLSLEAFKEGLQDPHYYFQSIYPK
ncbi:MAG: glycosyl hydrolase [Thermoanaerobacteraceae bacterium]|nr:glycosyl hydrolase [Thermoanaerobacteraceae bacterium]